MRLADGDAKVIHNYFRKMQVENDRFFFSIDLDEEDRLKNIFWTNVRSRATYRNFENVVTFETTHLTKMYDMPFAHFVGINHHGHYILLGYGLISHEDSETFKW